MNLRMRVGACASVCERVRARANVREIIKTFVLGAVREWMIKLLMIEKLKFARISCGIACIARDIALYRDGKNSCRIPKKKLRTAFRLTRLLY